MTRFKTAAIALAASAGLTLGAFAMASPAAATTYTYTCSGGWSGQIEVEYSGGIDTSFSLLADVSEIVGEDEWPNLEGTADGASIEGAVVGGWVLFEGEVSPPGPSPSGPPSTIIIVNPVPPPPDITCVLDD